MKYYSILLVAAMLMACGKDPDNNGADSSYKEPVPETITFDQAEVSYYGDPYMSDVSDMWTIELNVSSAESPAPRLCVSLNAEVNPAAAPDAGFLAGTYHMPSNSGDMSAGTYNTGYTDTQDRPNGAVEIPAGSYFLPDRNGDASTADLLREGGCTVTAEADGRITIEGIMVGTDFMKRYFSYEGKPDVADRTHGGESSGIPNSDLTEDVEPTSFTQTRLVDKGDIYFLGDESYRQFEFYLADEGIDLSTQWPGGTGELLRIELFVPWDTTAEAGLPTGTYTVPTDIPPYGGMYREDIVPFNIIPGYPDRFTNNSGTWYQYLEDGQWVRYARITGGTITVERPDGKYRISVDLTDCATPANHVRCVWSN